MNKTTRSMPFRILLSILLTTGLTACGFHLRGIHELPFDSVSIQGDSDPSFQQQLERALQQNRVAVVSDSETWLILQPLQQSRRITGVSQDTLASEYELTLSLEAGVKWNQQWLIPNKQFITRRRYDFDSSNIGAINEQERDLLEEMQQELIQLLMRRLAFAPSFNTITKTSHEDSL